MDNETTTKLQHRVAGLEAVVRDARDRLDAAWSVTPADPVEMKATDWRPLSVREALRRYDDALSGGTAALDAAVAAAVAAERARIAKALNAAWATMLANLDGKPGLYINGAHAIYEPMLAAIGGAS